MQVTYFYLAIGQIMLYVDGMNGVMKHNYTIQWLYSLLSSRVGSYISDLINICFLYTLFKQMFEYIASIYSCVQYSYQLRYILRNNKKSLVHLSHLKTCRNNFYCCGILNQSNLWAPAFNPLSANQQNGQTHANNSSATADELFEYVWPFCRVGT